MCVHSPTYSTLLAVVWIFLYTGEVFTQWAEVFRKLGATTITCLTVLLYLKYEIEV